MGDGVGVTYGLARMVLGSRSFIETSREEFEAVSAAVDGLTEVTEVEEKLDLLLENYAELEADMLRVTVGEMIFRDLDYATFARRRGLFNRRIVNLLTAARMYVDHVPRHMGRVLDGDVRSKAEVGAHFSESYDSSLSYRLMEALRNHVQHRAFPIHKVTFRSAWHEEGGETKLEFSVGLEVLPDELAEDGKFKASVLGELRASGGKVDLKRAAREYVQALALVHEKVREKIKDRTSAWEAVVAGAESKFQGRFPGEDIIGLAAVVRRPNGTVQEHVPIARHLVQYRKFLEGKNAVLATLSKRYVTGRAALEAR